MFWLIDHLAYLIPVLLTSVVGLWIMVGLETYRTTKQYRRLRRMRRERTHLVTDLHRIRLERDYWYRAYWQAAYRGGDDPHPTLTIVPPLKDENAPVS